MKLRFSPYLAAGILILAVYLIVDRFIQPIVPVIAIPVLLLSIVLIFIDGIRKRQKK